MIEAVCDMLPGDCCDSSGRVQGKARTWCTIWRTTSATLRQETEVQVEIWFGASVTSWAPTGDNVYEFCGFFELQFGGHDVNTQLVPLRLFCDVHLVCQITRSYTFSSEAILSLNNFH